ncbi:hypothetical protein ABI59_18975 [Acidobacteria bacterium Mor1]|nr:hypothetical protein ABI59_18975 [Acidobacteria bacterium Mor1]
MILAACLLILCAGCAKVAVRTPVEAAIPSGLPTPPKVTADAPPLPALRRVDLEQTVDGWPAVADALDAPLTFSLNVESASIAEVMQIFAERAGRSFLIAPGVDATVSVAFEDVRLVEAVEQVLLSRGLTARLEGNAVMIDRMPLASTVFHLSAPLLAGEDGQGPWASIGGSLELSLSPRGSLRFDQLGGTLLVRDHPANIDAVEQTLEALIEPHRRQVMIEAMVFEVELSDDLEYGIDWTAPDLVAEIFGSETTGSIGTALAPATGALTASFASNKLQGLLRALRSRGQLTVLSAPRVTTLNQVPARIAITEEIPFYTADVVPVGQEPIQSITVEFRQAGITLDVTPVISADGEVLLTLHPEITELTGFTPALQGLPPNPILDKREVQTVVRARNGESVLLAGLIRRRYNEQRSEVPGLGRVPGLGAAFRSIDQTSTRTELALVITPIVADAGVNREALDLSIERLRQLQEPYSRPGILPSEGKREPSDP